MDDAALLQEFEALAERLSIQVRYADLEREGGLCRYRDGDHLIINKRLTPQAKIAVFARALAPFPLDDVFVIPAIREALDAYRLDRENA
ncbi:MAG: hypothetical protein HY710_06990 [Candidatus Latescibacteria bacterium]|nr:hypothetical protein [Candidatus Latescibacterota bacterium]